MPHDNRATNFKFRLTDHRPERVAFAVSLAALLVAAVALGLAVLATSG